MKTPSLLEVSLRKACVAISNGVDELIPADIAIGLKKELEAAIAEQAKPQEMIGVQAAWMAAGGNPEIRASMDVLLDLLKVMNSDLDEYERQATPQDPVARVRHLRE